MSDRQLIFKIISILFLLSSILQEFNYCCCAFSFNTVIIIGSGTRSRTVQQDGISLMPRSLSSSSSSSSELFMTSSASTSVSAPVSESVAVAVAVAVSSVSVTEEDSVEEIERKKQLKEKFETLRRGFPKNANIVNAGGWYNLEQLSHDPKSTLTQFIIDGIKKEVTLQHHHNHQESKSSSEKEKHHDHEGIEKENQERDNEKLNALCLLLYGMGKGFIADTMDGEWDIVFTKSSTKSTTTGTTSTATTTTTSSSRNTVVLGGNSNNNSNKSKNNRGNRLFFNIQKLIFQKRYTFLKWGLLINTIKYLPTSENYSISSNGKIVVRRIVCTLLNRILKWWKLPSIKLPTIRSIKKRYLDIIYLDDDICISGSGFGSGFGGSGGSGDSSESGRQNQNQLFIHFRPNYLQTMMSQYNRFTATTTTLSGSGIGHSNSNSNNYGDILDDSLC